MKKIVLVLVAALTAGAAIAATPQVIAHRGYHATKGSCRNSIAALEQAQKLGIFGSECDLNLTADGKVLVIHGSHHPGRGIIEGDDIKRVKIQRSTADEVQAIPLENGEKVPTLDEYLAQAKKCKRTKLIIEIKNHDNPQNEAAVAKATVEKVAEYGLQERVEYIAFHLFVCQELQRLAPKGTQIAYLNGDLAPEYVKGLGLTGIDYKLSVLKKNPEWIKQAQDLGLTVNVWTVNKEEDLRWVIGQGVDYITTDHPQLAVALIDQLCGK